MKKNMKKPLTLLAVPFLTLGASAQADFYSHRYAGFSFASTEETGFCDKAAQRVQSLTDDSVIATNGGCGEGSDSWKVFGGWRWTPHLAVEGSYQQFDASDFNFRLDAENDEYLTFKDEVQTRLFNASFVGHWPLAAGFSLFGKAGGGLWFSEMSERVRGEVLYELEYEDGSIEELRVPVREKSYANDNGFFWSYGGGVSYRHHNRWTLRAEWQQFADIGSENLFGGEDLQSLSLGWSMHF